MWSPPAVRKQVPGNSFRLAVGPDALRSTLITDIEREGERRFILKGMAGGTAWDYANGVHAAERWPGIPMRKFSMRIIRMFVW